MLKEVLVYEAVVDMEIHMQGSRLHDKGFQIQNL